MSVALQSAFARVRLVPEANALARFVASADPEAFAAVVRRYGPVVYAVCRRVLGNAPDADDAFQATFLVLLRKANSVKAGSLGGWLFAVAYRTAVYARGRRAARRTQPLDPDAMPAAVPEPTSDVLAALDAELANLPVKYREPVVRCELDGQTIAEAAKALRVPVGTVASRLARGRQMLADRLRRQGFAAVCISGLLAGSATARVPTKLVLATLGEPVGPVSELATGTLKMLLVSKLKLAAKAGVAAVLVAAGVLAVGLGGGSPGVPVAHAAPVPKEAAEVKGKKLDDLWAMLLVQDEAVSARALLELSARPKKEVVAFLADKLKPLTLSEERAKKLVADLGAEKEETAKAAHDELSYFDPRLVLTVDDMLKDLPDGVHRRRVAALLLGGGLDHLSGCKVEYSSSATLAARNGGEKYPGNFMVEDPNRQRPGGGIAKYSTAVAETPGELSGWRWHKQWGRATRAVMILEHLGTPEAVKALEAMATGHADASPTKAAKEALERLKK